MDGDDDLSYLDEELEEEVEETPPEAEPEAGEDESEDDAPPPPPPSAAELKVDVSGFGPARAELVRFVAWQKATDLKLAELETARTNYLEQMGVATVTEKKLRALVESDAAAHLAWIKSGASKVSRKDARSYERKQLDDKLAADRHQSEIARMALDALETEIDQTRKLVASLIDRHQGFVLDALIEHADLIAVEYLRHVQSAKRALLPLMGLHEVVKDRGGYRDRFASPAVRVELPTFALPALRDDLRPDRVRMATSGSARPPAVVILGAETKQAAEPWRNLLKTWIANPRTEPPAMIADAP